jgi:hypothetical protein
MNGLPAGGLQPFIIQLGPGGGLGRGIPLGGGLGGGGGLGVQPFNMGGNNAGAGNLAALLGGHGLGNLGGGGGLGVQPFNMGGNNSGAGDLAALIGGQGLGNLGGGGGQTWTNNGTEPIDITNFLSGISQDIGGSQDDQMTGMAAYQGGYNPNWDFDANRLVCDYTDATNTFLTRYLDLFSSKRTRFGITTVEKL